MKTDTLINTDVLPLDPILMSTPLRDIVGMFNQDKTEVYKPLKDLELMEFLNRINNFPIRISRPSQPIINKLSSIPYFSVKEINIGTERYLELNWRDTEEVIFGEPEYRERSKVSFRKITIGLEEIEVQANQIYQIHKLTESKLEWR